MVVNTYGETQMPMYECNMHQSEKVIYPHYPYKMLPN